MISDQIALVLEKEQLIGEQAVIIERKSEVISEQQKRIAILEEALRLSKTKRFAPSSEQGHQLSLFDEAEVEADAETERDTDTKETDELTGRKKKPGRQPFSAKLPREQIFITLTDDAEDCPKEVDQ